LIINSINDIYGSLLRPGNITVVVARSGVGKTQFCMDYSTKVSLEYNVPVLHFDNGEMSKEELIMRQCSALSGVPMHLIESGQWLRAGKETVDKVRNVWAKVKKLQFYYYNVGGMDVDSMINTLKRFYYSKVGRGNRMIFSFDYIKTTSDMGSGNKTEWQVVGEMVDKFKRCVQKDILYNGVPIIPMITSVPKSLRDLRSEIVPISP
jgi:replicative DNA helicase